MSADGCLHPPPGKHRTRQATRTTPTFGFRPRQTTRTVADIRLLAMRAEFDRPASHCNRQPMPPNALSQYGVRRYRGTSPRICPAVTREQDDLLAAIRLVPAFEYSFVQASLRIAARKPHHIMSSIPPMPPMPPPIPPPP